LIRFIKEQNNVPKNFYPTFSYYEFNFAVVIVAAGETFNVPTHRDLSRRAVKKSILDNSLKNDVEFIAGLNEELEGRTMLDLVGDGSANKDNHVRPLNHFHDPTKPWNQAAGLLSAANFFSCLI
jgi:hypothetical protein